jgi:hypothetical protein
VDAITHLQDLPWISVDYERMLADPRRGMDVLAEKLAFGGWPRTPSDEELRGFADPGLLHHPPAPPQSGEWLETSCYAFYEELRTRHLQGPDAALTRHVDGLRAQIGEGRGLTLELIQEVYAEIPRLRACKLSMELARQRAE